DGGARPRARGSSDRMLWRSLPSTGSHERGRRVSGSGRVSALGRLLALALVIAPLAAGCSVFGKDKYDVPDEPAEKLYNEGVFLLNQRKSYAEAAKKFEEVERQHPYSEWARKSLIMTAY